MLFVLKNQLIQKWENFTFLHRNGMANSKTYSNIFFADLYLVKINTFAKKHICVDELLLLFVMSATCYIYNSLYFLIDLNYFIYMLHYKVLISVKTSFFLLLKCGQRWFKMSNIWVFCHFTYKWNTFLGLGGHMSQKLGLCRPVEWMEDSPCPQRPSLWHSPSSSPSWHVPPPPVTAWKTSSEPILDANTYPLPCVSRHCRAMVTCVRDRCRHRRASAQKKEEKNAPTVWMVRVSSACARSASSNFFVLRSRKPAPAPPPPG